MIIVIIIVVRCSVQVFDERKALIGKWVSLTTDPMTALKLFYTLLFWCCSFCRKTPHLNVWYWTFGAGFLPRDAL